MNHAKYVKNKLINVKNVQMLSSIKIKIIRKNAIKYALIVNTEMILVQDVPRAIRPVLVVKDQVITVQVVIINII